MFSPGDVCVLPSGMSCGTVVERTTFKHGPCHLQASLLFLLGEDVTAEDLVGLNEDEQCEKCTGFNRLNGGQYPTNHSTSECLRCSKCKAWLKTQARFENHVCNGQQICKFFAGGYCRDGDLCEFSHASQTTQQRTKSPSKKSRNIFQRERCVFFDRGECKKGDSCPFKHGVQECSKCGGGKHDDRHCAQCFKCNGWGHMAADCVNQ